MFSVVLSSRSMIQKSGLISRAVLDLRGRFYKSSWRRCMWFMTGRLSRHSDWIYLYFSPSIFFMYRPKIYGRSPIHSLAPCHLQRQSVVVPSKNAFEFHARTTPSLEGYIFIVIRDYTSLGLFLGHKEESGRRFISKPSNEDGRKMKEADFRS